MRKQNSVSFFICPPQIDQISYELKQILHLTSCILTNLQMRFRVNEQPISSSEQVY